MNFWLLKSDISDYTIDDLQRDGFTHWDGVRNYQARNYMRDKMSVGDLALFYHSNASPPGVAGICRICGEPVPDYTAWDPKSDHYDKRSSPEHPIWEMVEVEFVQKFAHFVSITEMRNQEKLKEMKVLRRGSRLSILPITRHQFEAVRRLGLPEDSLHL